MKAKYPTYKSLDLPKLVEEQLEYWDSKSIFQRSVDEKDPKKPYVFFEGPPSANGLPGIHHAMGRSIKDIFCRYKTLKGFQVQRKAGWDTHGLPVELGVEKRMGIKKVDIGTKISETDYNEACKTSVMQYTDIWNDLTKKLGYWVDMSSPYITYSPKYMESVWWILKQVYNKDLIYKGYTIQPYSPAAGTGLSTHELNQPGCYKDVTDTTVVAQFLAKTDSLPAELSKYAENIHFLAWTTTPWTLPSNTALAVGKDITYVLVETFNSYTFEKVYLLLAENLVQSQFKKPYVKSKTDEDLTNYKSGDKKIPYQILTTIKGQDLIGVRYNQLMDFHQPNDNPEQAFRVVGADFVTTKDGTGIVHIAPTFGADDHKAATDAGVPAMLIKNEKDELVPLVNLQGQFVDGMDDYSGQYVKNEYYNEGEAPEKSLDVQIAIQLKTENKAFRVEKYAHNYPHCWRTDKPILYYPLDSWFVKVSEIRDQLVENNQKINWKPKATGEKRFGNWLKDANDWNLSRSRFWGIPLPIWRNKDSGEALCIGSIEELKTEIDKAVSAGLMTENPFQNFVVGDMSESNYDQVDLHKHIVDQIVLVSDSGQALHRESDLIDVWFDSGSMPFAQWHYPFENKEKIDDRQSFPADFIAEGVDQTRGWFYTMHVISTIIKGEPAYKNVISNGLVLDSDGNKMSKSKGNVEDPFKIFDEYGADLARWYMISNAQPWDNLKFDKKGLVETQRKLFSTLYNTYTFFTTYANLDGFCFDEDLVKFDERPELDRWILSELQTLTKNVDEALADFEPTQATRLMQDFVNDRLSNWYVRLCRRRFWKGDYNQDKISAYQTLYTCLKDLAIMASPIAPFFMDRLYLDLTSVLKNKAKDSVHLADFPTVNSDWIDKNLEDKMQLAQRSCSLILAVRQKEKLKVRQPLQKVMIPADNQTIEDNLRAMEHIILSEVNIKSLEILRGQSDKLVKQIKANFKALGPKFGKQMKAVAQAISTLSQEQILDIEKSGTLTLNLGEEQVEISLSDVEITTKDIPGWSVISQNGLTVALDIQLSPELKREGLARDLINRIQNIRKDAGFELTDNIDIQIEHQDLIADALAGFEAYIAKEVLAKQIELKPELEDGLDLIIDDLNLKIKVSKSL
ncbi:MAG: isoleucine--tRNA ligase [Flavobacteriales bacterium]